MSGPMRYDRASLRGDYLRASIGAGFCAGAVILAGPVGWASYIFGAGGLLFLAFGGRTAIRHAQSYQLTEEGLRLATNAPGLRTPEIRWAELDRVKLRYFTTKRDRREGWMQLSLRAPGARFSIDSTLDGFFDILEATAAAAGANGLQLDRASLTNFLAMGIEPPPQAAGRDQERTRA